MKKTVNKKVDNTNYEKISWKEMREIHHRHTS